VSGQRAPLTVTLARPAGPGRARVRLRVARLGFVNKRGSLRLQQASVADERTLVIERGTRTVTLDAPRPPFRVTAEASPTFVPKLVVPGSRDDRELSVRINFGSR